MNERYIEGSEALIQALIDNKIKLSKKAAMPVGFDGSCHYCEELVPIARIELGFYNCVDCQTLVEEYRKAGKTLK